MNVRNLFSVIFFSAIFCLCPLLKARDVVYLADLQALEPRDAVSETRAYGKWHLRRVKWAEHAQGVLNLTDSASVPDLTFPSTPEGRYHVYVGCRRIDLPTVLQVRLGDDPLWYTVDPGLATNGRHVNLEILVARDIPLDGKRLKLHAVSDTIYFYYFKLVKTAVDQAARVDPARVTREPRRTMDRRDVEALIRAGGFKERVYVDNQPMPPLTPQQEKQGFVLFRRHYLNLTFPNTLPAANEVVDRVAIFASPGEVEPVSLAIRTLRPLAGVRAVPSDFQGPGGVLLPARVIDVRVVKYLRKRSTRYRGGGEFMEAPIFLEAFSSLDLRADETRQFWLTIRVPEQARPGDYESIVTVGTPTAMARIKLQLRVLPIKLPDTPGDYVLGMYDLWPRGVTPLEERFRDMRDHGMTTVGWCGDSGLDLRLADGKLEFSFDGALLTRVLDAHGRIFTQPLLWLMHGDLDRFCLDRTDGEAEYADLYGRIVKEILAYCERRRFPGIVFQPADECPSRPAKFPSAIRQLRALKAVGAITEMDHMGFRYAKRPEVDRFVQQAMPSTDILTLRYSAKPIWYDETWQQLGKLCRRNGKGFWTYNINNGLAFPEPTSNRFSTGFFFHTLGRGCTGEFYWAYQHPSQALYVDLDGKATDWLCRYPPWKPEGETGGPTILWECLREGVDDLRYIEALRSRIREVDPINPQAAEKARIVLNDILDSFSFDQMAKAGCKYLESKWDRQFTGTDGRLACSGDFLLPNGWKAEGYDRARRRIAEAILDL